MSNDNDAPAVASKPEGPLGPAKRELGRREADLSEAARKSVEGDAGKPARPSADPPPAAGPHADLSLQNPDATPGAGTLPSGDRQGDEVEAAGG